MVKLQYSTIVMNHSCGRRIMFVMLTGISLPCTCIAMCWNMFWLVIHQTPLLRIVQMAGKGNDTIHARYEKPIYIPLQKKHFDSIEIDIRTDTGKPVPFEYGK